MVARTQNALAPVDGGGVLLVASSGGHLLQLVWLARAFEHVPRVWVTEDAADTRSLLVGEAVVYAYGPAHRDLALGLHRIALAWARNLVLAVRLVRRARPRALVTTGAGAAVPFAWVARALGADVIFVESLTRVDKPSMSARLIAPIASRVYVQWPDAVEHLPRSRYVGSLFGVR
jgi:UDP-N-acetylglucosamine:LPS N-acetylglucosamine transferase